MSWILPPGETLRFEGLEQPLTILTPLGGGSQGQVYAVQLGREQLALKWYFPACIARDPDLERRLAASIRATRPSEAFLWPMALLRVDPGYRSSIRTREPGFGYLMPLRPDSFVAAHEHVAGRLTISLRNVLLAGLHLARAFHELHLKGLCYKDISLANLFLDPGSGRILICDNDNVDVDGSGRSAVLGTPGFIAPEVLMGRARPGSASDLFSLAVLLFRLLTRHDPLRGRRELDIRCLDEPARRRLYGEEPLFIFDPLDERNRPDPIEHAAVLTTWPIYPPELQALFQSSFGPGLGDPGRRVLTGQWLSGLAHCLDQRRLCPVCGQENFRPVESAAPCWACGAALPALIWLELPSGRVAASPGNTLHRHHFDPLAPINADLPLAELVAHPSEAGVIGLRNRSAAAWQAERRDGGQTPVEAGRSCNLAGLRQIRTPAGPIRLKHPSPNAGP